MQSLPATATFKSFNLSSCVTKSYVITNVITLYCITFHLLNIAATTGHLQRQKTPHPMPQVSQQDSRSSDEISTLTLALLWIHTRSDMASAAPKAWGQRNHGASQTFRRSLDRKASSKQTPSKLLPSRIHRSPGPWSPSEWGSWAIVLWRQSFSVTLRFQHTEPCQEKQCFNIYSVIVALNKRYSD